ncbi:ABC transporter permease [Kallotenue papyrolyticum]|uniref:ABC transporter permease n=1 Tax=Kallotenue papyrolyticum TaxID=1325125 RepID=UPI00046F4A7B|nr:ABC transporter permease [Kallotenue papyrolyticum]
MSDLWEALWTALRLLLRGDPALWQIIGLSLGVSGAALLISSVVGVPLGAWLALHRFPGRRLATTLIYTGMGLPPVVVGLVVYLLLSRAGPLGAFGWLFTPRAMIMAQTMISLPLVAGLTMSAVESIDEELRLQLRALGATSGQIARATLWEARGGMLVALVAGFGSIISEVGAVMLVGGNIEGATRVLTTAIVLETRRGAWDQALALAIVLLGLTFFLNLIALRLRQRLLPRP